MGWLRLVGSLKIQVSFSKEPYKRDYILQKRPIFLRSLLIIYVCVPCCSSCNTIYICVCVCVCVCTHTISDAYAPVTSTCTQIELHIALWIGLFFKGARKKRRYSAKETYNFKEPNRSHLIALWGGYGQ